MSNTYLIYRAETGEILRTGMCPVWHAALQVIDEGDVLIMDPAPDVLASTHYVVGGVVTERPSITLAEIPPGSRYVIGGDPSGELFTGEVDETGIVFDLPGTWEVIIEPPFPYRRLDVILTFKVAPDA